MVVHLPKVMTCGLAAPEAALVSDATPISMTDRDKERCILPPYASGGAQNKGTRHIHCNIVPNRESFGIAVCTETNPPLVIPKPGLSARNLLVAGTETADSS